MRGLPGSHVILRVPAGEDPDNATVKAAAGSAEAFALVVRRHHAAVRWCLARYVREIEVSDNGLIWVFDEERRLQILDELSVRGSLQRPIRWVNDRHLADTATPLAQAGDAEAGKALYTPCVACHGPNAEGMPALNSPGRWRRISAPGRRSGRGWCRHLPKARHGRRP